jgi:hypothetical protein
MFFLAPPPRAQLSLKNTPTQCSTMVLFQLEYDGFSSTQAVYVPLCRPEVLYASTIALQCAQKKNGAYEIERGRVQVGRSVRVCCRCFGDTMITPRAEGEVLCDAQKNHVQTELIWLSEKTPDCTIIKNMPKHEAHHHVR